MRSNQVGKNSGRAVIIVMINSSHEHAAISAQRKRPRSIQLQARKEQTHCTCISIVYKVYGLAVSVTLEVIYRLLKFLHV